MVKRCAMLGAVALLMLDWMLNKDRELVSYKPLAIFLESSDPILVLLLENSN